jgi:hypothetical protein
MTVIWSMRTSGRNCILREIPSAIRLANSTAGSAVACAASPGIRAHERISHVAHSVRTTSTIAIEIARGIRFMERTTL